MNPPASSDCPERQELADFLVGKLLDSRFEVVAAHVDECATCRETVDRLSDSSIAFRHEIKDPDEASDSSQQLEVVLNNLERELDPDALRQPTEEHVFEGIGNYQILNRLGRGGMGTVYRARHDKLNRIVAIKVLMPERMRDASAVARFQREMEAIGPLEHPHIVRAYDADQRDGTHFLAMEFVDGVDLSTLLRSHGPLRSQDACELVRQAAIGLQYVHENGLVHRDVKPSNLMLAGGRSTGSVSSDSSNATVKILDLGLALLNKSDTDAASMTSADQLMGTLDYMAPEQAVSTHTVDIRADIYGLGATLYKLLSGRAPLDGNGEPSKYEKLNRLLTTSAPSIAAQCPDLDRGLVFVVDRMLARSPDERFATPGEVVDALKPFTKEADLDSVLNLARDRAGGAVALTERAIRPSQLTEGAVAPSRIRALLIVAALIAVMGTFAFWMYGSPDSTDPPVSVPAETDTSPPPKFVSVARLLHIGLPTHLAKLGTSVDMDGDYAVVGAPGTFGGEKRTGAAYVFAQTDAGGWRLAATLYPDESAIASQFGQSVALEGDTILVGAPLDREGERSGAVYVFERDSDAWRQTQKLLPEVGSRRSRFGASVGISQRHAIVTTISGNATVVDVFHRDDDTWRREQTLAPSAADTIFGPNVAIDNGRIVVVRKTSLNSQNEAITAVVFAHGQDAWGEQQALSRLGSVRLGQVSPAVAIDGDRLVVGAPKDPTGNEDQTGVASAYRWDGERWELQQTLSPASTEQCVGFGAILAIDGAHLLVGAVGRDGQSQSGAVYSFELNGDEWSQSEQMVSNEVAADDRFGVALAVSGQRAIVAAPGFNGNARGEGDVHFLDRDGETWRRRSQGSQLVAGVPTRIEAATTSMGAAVALGADFFAIGASFADSANDEDSGAVHFYSVEGDYQQTLCAPVPEKTAGFGVSVVAAGDALLVGAVGSKASGAVYVFQRQAESWLHQEILEPDDEKVTAFGGSMSLDGEYLAIAAAPREFRTAPGVVYLFRRSNDGWERVQILQANDAVPDDGFGAAFSLNG
ncbi:MAG: protein kinase, partial [Pirellulaceae bacterium]|nr:protein kinase [Pirellulaceae bacterium]